MTVRRTVTGSASEPVRRSGASAFRSPAEPDTNDLPRQVGPPRPGEQAALQPSRPQPNGPPGDGSVAASAGGYDRTGSGAQPARPARTGPRRARLLVTRLDPWSVMKTFFMLSLAVAIVIVVATALLWWTLEVTGVFDAVNRTVDDVVGTGSTPFDFMAVVGFERVMGTTLVLAAIEIVLVSAMATLFAFLYNLTVGFTRGLEITLTEDN